MIEIRKAGINDIDQLVILFDSYRMFYDKPSDTATAKQFLTARISNKESEVFMAFDTGLNKAVGFVQLYPLFSSTRMKRLWLLNDLFVDETYRGKGISVQLTDAAKALCKETGSCGMMLETAKTNAVGNALYPKTGFVLDNDHNYYSWDV